MREDIGSYQWSLGALPWKEVQPALPEDSSQGAITDSGNTPPVEKLTESVTHSELQRTDFLTSYPKSPSNLHRSPSELSVKGWPRLRQGQRSSSYRDGALDLWWHTWARLGSAHTSSLARYSSDFINEAFVCTPDTERPLRPLKGPAAVLTDKCGQHPYHSTSFPRIPWDNKQWRTPHHHYHLPSRSQREREKERKKRPSFFFNSPWWSNCRKDGWGTNR